MKTFQKIILASAISAAPFASQAMEALDDSVLGNTTGQAGVTIEIDIADTGVTIGEIEYIDTDTGTADGSVLLQNIKITNADITQTIDVDADGSLILGISDITDLTVDIGNVGGLTPNSSAVALKSAAGNVTEVVNDVHLVMDLQNTTTTLVNLQETTNIAKYGVDSSFDNGTDPVANSWEGSLAIQANAQININDLDVGMFGYTAEQAQTRAQLHPGVTAAKGSLDTAAPAGLAYDANGVATATDPADVDVATYNATLSGTSNAIAGGSAIQLENIKFYGTGGESSFATVNQTIWAKGGTVAQGGGVYIAMGEIAGTLEIGGIVMGGNSIGSVKISDINLAGMTQRIYGH
jgi:hypothetical protein